MANVWAVGAKQISKAMRLDKVELFVSIPTKNAIGEEEDSLVSMGVFKANITTPQESIDEVVSGTVRTHNYQITLDVDVQLPRENKIFVKILETRQGDVGAVLEVSSLQGGLLGQTLNAADEQN